MQSFPPDVTLQLPFFMFPDLPCFIPSRFYIRPIFLLSRSHSLCLSAVFFFIPSLSSLDMLATYSIIQDLIKCDIKKVTLRNEQLLSVKRIPTSILLQGSIPAVEHKKNLAVALYKLCCCVSKHYIAKHIGRSAFTHMNFNGIPFSICRV